MAVGNPPPEAFVDVPQGLWVAPRWLGANPGPMIGCVFIEMLGFLGRTPAAIISCTIIVLAWAFVLRLQFERDPHGFRLRTQNIYYLRRRRMRGVALVSSRRLPFNAKPR